MLLASSLCYSTRAVPDYTVLSCASEDALARGPACTAPASKGLRQGGGGARDRPRVRDGRSKTIATATGLDRVATASVHQLVPGGRRPHAGSACHSLLVPLR